MNGAAGTVLSIAFLALIFGLAGIVLPTPTGGGAGGAPANAHYVVTQLHVNLTNEHLHSGLAGADLHAPATHAASHQSGGADSIKLDDLAGPDDNTDLDATAVAHGLLPKLSGDAGEYLDGTGNWTTPEGGNGGLLDSYGFLDSYASVYYASGTYYYGFPTRMAATEATTEIVFPINITMKKITWYCDSNTLNGQMNFTLRKNGGNTAITIVIPAATTGVFTSTNDVTYTVDADTCTMQMVESSSSGLANVKWVAMFTVD